MPFSDGHAQHVGLQITSKRRHQWFAEISEFTGRGDVHFVEQPAPQPTQKPEREEEDGEEEQQTQRQRGL